MSFSKLLFMPNHWAPYFMAAQTPYQAFCTWQTLVATMSVEADRADLGIPMLNWFGAACVRAGNGNVQRTRSSLAIEWGSVLPDRSLLRWATKRLAPSASPFRSNTRTPTDFHPSHKALQSPRPRYQNGEPSRPRKTASSTRRHSSSLRTHAHPSTT